MTGYGKIIFLTMFAATVLAGDPVVLKCEPLALHGIPGVPLSAELTVETPDAKPARILIPAVSNLVLRTVEKVPIQRTATGQFIQKRIVIWQGVEAGQTVLTNLTAEVSDMQYTFPTLEISIDTVPVALPPDPAPSAVEGDAD